MNFIFKKIYSIFEKFQNKNMKNELNNIRLNTVLFIKNNKIKVK